MLRSGDAATMAVERNPASARSRVFGNPGMSVRSAESGMMTASVVSYALPRVTQALIEISMMWFLPGVILSKL